MKIGLVNQSWLDFIKHRPIVAMFLAGILLRLMLMPFFAHVDLFSEFRRVVYSINNDIYFPQQNRLTTFYVEYLFVRLLFPFLQNPDHIFFMESLSRSTSNLTDYFIFINDLSVYRHLFIIKLPYLVADLLTAWVIWQFFDDEKRARLAMLIWLFNPITLYASYIFGRYEAIPIFFVALSVLLLKRQHPYWAAFALSLAINGREIYVVLAPIFLISMYLNKESLIKNFLRLTPAALIFLISVATPILLESAVGLRPAFSQGAVYGDSKANILFGMAYQWFYPLVFAYFMTLFIYFSKTSDESTSKFIAASGIVIASYFLFAGHSAHYVAWLPLFPVLLLAYPNQVRPLVIALVFTFLMWLLYRVFKADVNLFSLFLGAPINFELIFFKNLQQVYSGFVGETRSIFQYTKVLHILHTGFAAALVFLIIKMHNSVSNREMKL